MHPRHSPSLVNDLHSALNPTRVAGIHQQDSIAGIRAIVADAARRGLPLAGCGGRHAMGGQQFAIDPDSRDFMQRGVFSCYLPVDDDTPSGGAMKERSERDWRALLRLAHIALAATARPAGRS